MLQRRSIIFSKFERIDLLKAWAAISLAFAILFGRGTPIGVMWVVIFFISVFTVGVAFVVHELAHKFTALHYGANAYFKSDDKMLGLAIIMSFFGFIFAAPGAVRITGHIGKNQYGKIAAAGPLANIILALIMLPLSLFGIQLASYALWINSYLALFNMIPFLGFDGKKILDWNKAMYIGMVIVSGALVVLFYI